MTGDAQVPSGNETARVHAVNLLTDDSFDADFSLGGHQNNHILGLLLEKSVTAVTVERWGQEQWRYTLTEPQSGRPSAGVPGLDVVMTTPVKAAPADSPLVAPPGFHLGRGSGDES